MCSFVPAGGMWGRHVGWRLVAYATPQVSAASTLPGGMGDVWPLLLCCRSLPSQCRLAPALLARPPALQTSSHRPPPSLQAVCPSRLVFVLKDGESWLKNGESDFGTPLKPAGEPGGQTGADGQARSCVASLVAAGTRSRKDTRLPEAPCQPLL